MSSTTQNSQSTYSISDSESSFVNLPDEQLLKKRTGSPFDEDISAAYAELQTILNAKSSVESRLRDLFTQRAHALEELERARRQLEFVDDEEKRMKKSFAGECFKEDTITEVGPFPPQTTRLPSNTERTDPNASHLIDAVRSEAPPDLIESKSKPRYGGNKIALRMAHEIERYETELKKQNLIVEETEKTAKEWDDVARKCAKDELWDGRGMALNEAVDCRLRVDGARERIKKLEWDKLVRTEIIAQFKEDEGE